jgi:hypothetical protein
MMKKRGRPKGSRNKSKIPIQDEQAVPLDIKEVKRQIRALKKCKKQTHKKSEERREINAKIRELKKQIIPIIKEVTPEKQKLIDEIIAWNTKYRPYLLTVMTITTYMQYTIEKLQKHIEYLKRRYING